MFEAYVCLFFIGSILGYFIELFYRKINKKKWINPGFLMGPYLPIYGFGLCILSFLYNYFIKFDFNIIVSVLIMGVFMSVIEFLAGLIFIKYGKIKLWDYSNNILNYKGIVCLKFSIYWILIALTYYLFFANYVIMFMSWYVSDFSFSFVLGMLFATIIIDFVYSSKIMFSVRKFARNNMIVIRYEELKREIREFKKDLRQKSSFLFPFSGNLINYLDGYYNKFNKEKKGPIIGHLFKK